MSNPLQLADWPSKLPSRAEMAPQVTELLPSWDAPGKIFGVLNFDGYVEALSDGYRELFGWTSAELMSVPYWEFVHAEDQHPMVESIERLMMQTSDLPLEVDLRVLRRDGTWLWTRWQTVADPTSELIYGVGEDTSEEMPPVQGRLRVGTWVRDVNAGTVEWSDEVYAMFGLPVGTAVNDEHVNALINPQDLSLVQAWRASIASDDDHAAQFRVTRPDGAIRTLRSAGRVTSRAAGRPVTMRGLTMDITDRHLA